MDSQALEFAIIYGGRKLVSMDAGGLAGWQHTTWKHV
jgi:hypothetical protein